MRFAELFAGAGGLSMGLEAAGHTCVWHAEIDPHARAVLQYRWPHVPLYGDVATLDGRELVQRHGPIDLLSGGSPCQDLSVAGKRQGLDGARSGLFHEQVRLWRETQAPLLLWENVPGALSSSHGADFHVVLSTLAGTDVPLPPRRKGRSAWPTSGVVHVGGMVRVAYRVLDLQHFGPPQRRRRVFLVATRTRAVDPAQVLADTARVCGCPAPGRGQAPPTGAPPAGPDPADDWHPAVFGALTDGAHHGGGLNGQDFYTGRVFVSSGRPRRLTPTECERLMGWPDGHTAHGTREDGTPYALTDSARYRLCGNGVGSPCTWWIGTRLAAHG